MINTQKVKSLVKAGLAACILSVATTYNATAQQMPAPQNVPPATDYTQEQLEEFATATKAMQQVQMEFQQKMVSAIQEAGMDPMTFQQMAQAQQNPEAKTEYTPEQQKAFSNAMNSIMGLQKSMQDEISSSLEPYDISLQEYQIMAMSIQQSPEVTEKVKTMMQ